jgi:hypothetical protein
MGIHKMKDNYILFLKSAYGYFIILFVLIALLQPRAVARLILLSMAYVPIVAVHIIVVSKTSAHETNKLFFLLSVLWVVKFVSFLTYEGLSVFTDGPIALGWFDLFLLLFLAVIVAISFVFRVPFFYVKSNEKSWIAIGVIFLMLSVWILIQIGFAFRDFLVGDFLADLVKG